MDTSLDFYIKTVYASFSVCKMDTKKYGFQTNQVCRTPVLGYIFTQWMAEIRTDVSSDFGKKLLSAVWNPNQFRFQTFTVETMSENRNPNL